MTLLSDKSDEKVMHSKIIPKLRAPWDRSHHSNTCIRDKLPSETWSSIGMYGLTY